MEEEHSGQAQANATMSREVVTDDISLNDDKNHRGHKRPINHGAYLCALLTQGSQPC